MHLLFTHCLVQGKGAATSSRPADATSADSSSSSNSRSKSSPTAASGPVLAPAVDMQQLAGQANSYVVCVPGLHSADEAARKMAQRLAATLGSECTQRAVA
jgi:hypothetical protein